MNNQKQTMSPPPRRTSYTGESFSSKPPTPGPYCLAKHAHGDALVEPFSNPLDSLLETKLPRIRTFETIILSNVVLRCWNARRDFH
jgi:hypothetical protein